MSIIALLYHLFSLSHYYITYNTLMAPSKFIKFNYKIFHYDTIITIISLITTTWYCYHYDTIISIIYIIHIITFIRIYNCF
jgi:hypothetical protein